MASDLQRLNRRQLLRLAGVSTGGLVLATHFGCKPTRHVADSFSPNLYVAISSNNRVTLVVARPEIGQGVRTSLPMILAEELDVAWEQVVVRTANVSAAAYGQQTAVSSRSIFLSWLPLRRAGAAARQMLVQAAAQVWGVAPNRCRTEAGYVLHRDTDKRASYGELVPYAQRQAIPMPQLLRLKSPRAFRLLGTGVSNVDSPAIVRGDALFAADQRLPGQLFATLTSSPRVAGVAVGDNRNEILALPGVRHVVDIPTNDGAPGGVAVIATNTFAAIKAQQQLRIHWQYPNNEADDWLAFLDNAKRLLAKDESQPPATGSPTRVDAQYQYAFVAHAQLEPLAALVWVQANRVLIRAASQQPNRAVTAVASALGRPAGQIEFQQVRGGGGFGRRLHNDFIVQAALIATQVDAPLLLQYRREDEFQRDRLRAGGLQRLTATLDSNGHIAQWRQRVVAPSHDGVNAVTGAALSAKHNGTEFPLPLVADAKAAVELLPWQSPCGQWRAPGANVMGFVVQSFLHELAVAAGQDHVDFLLTLLGRDQHLAAGDYRSLNTARAKGVITAVADLANLNRVLPAGEGLGLAFHFSHSGYVAQVAHVKVVAPQRFKVLRVVAAVDVGQVVNLSGAKGQVEGSIIDGLSVLANQSVEHSAGVVAQTNLHQYSLLKLASAPEIDVQFIASNHRPTGLGEPALPPVAPAVGNALYVASGERVRVLPFSAAGWRLV